MRDLEMQIDKQVLVSTLLINILHMQDYGLTSGNQVTASETSYYCICHIYSLETDIFTVHHKVNSSLLTSTYVSRHYQVFLKTALLGLNPRQYCLINLQLESCILTVATAGVIFTAPCRSC